MSTGRMDFEFSFGSGATPPRPEPGDGFRIVVLADLSGRASRGLMDAAVHTRRLHRVDIDNLDEVISACGVVIRLSAPEPMDIPIKRLDDFHPDHLYRTLPAFAALRDLRARLMDPATFADAATELRAVLGDVAAVSAAAPATGPAGTQAASSAGLLESLLGGRPAVADAPVPPAPKTAASVAAEFVRRISQGPSSAARPAADPQQPALLAALDDLISAQMRAIMHTPAFQRVEAAWRAVHFLITSMLTDENLTIDLVDVCRGELAADMQAAAASQAGVRQCALAGLVAERSTAPVPGVEPWSLIVTDLSFDFTTADAALAAHLAAIAARAGAPILGAASTAHIGCASLAMSPDPDSWNVRSPAGDDAAPAAWAAVRQCPEAQHLCLTLPRFLLRAPYSPGGDAIESFAFDEVAMPSDHESFLWASAAFAAAVLIASAYAEDGPEMVLPDAGDIEGLPVHTFVSGGEKQVTPAAEAWLTLKASHVIQAAGLSPLLSIKGRDAARLATIQSIADPIAPLAGRWG